MSYLNPARTEKMDIYLPQGSGSSVAPAVLLIHGGGWVGGDKADHRNLTISTELAENGYAVFAINYHLADPHAAPDAVGAWPQNIYDAKSALRYIRAKAQTYGIDPAHIGVMGQSAGGHLALLLAETQGNSSLNAGGSYREQSNDVSCVVDMYGVANLKDPSLDFVRAPFRGSSDTETVSNLTEANPVELLPRRFPPLLILHGTADALVPIAQSRELVSRMRARGLNVQLVEVAGAPHSFDFHPAGANLTPTVLRFLQGCLR